MLQKVEKNLLPKVTILDSSISHNSIPIQSTIMHCLSIILPWSTQQDMINIHRYNITNNFIMIWSNFQFHKTLLYCFLLVLFATSTSKVGASHSSISSSIMTSWSCKCNTPKLAPFHFKPILLHYSQHQSLNHKVILH